MFTLRQATSTDLVGSGIERALSIQRISKGVSDDIIRKQVSKLANDYDALRLSLPSGEDRTKSLERIAAQMKSLGFAVEPLLNELKVSASAGERLAAVTSLELNPQEDFLDWLVERIDVERPFVGYHAALALLAAIRAFTPPHEAAPDSISQTASSKTRSPYLHACEAVRKAMKILEDKGLRDTDRYAVLDAARKDGMCP